jgi:glucosaminylphosphatidylinositol acyltransferase
MANATNSSAASYKQLKEDFVSNLSGGSAIEISYVTAVAPVRIFWSLIFLRNL